MGPQSQLTTLWTGSDVYLIYSIEAGQSGAGCKIIRLNATDCDCKTYVEKATILLGKDYPREIRLIWAILQESFPYSGLCADNSARQDQQTSLYSTCWTGLPRQWLPAQTFSGMEAIKFLFKEFEQLSHPGHCLYFKLGARLYLLGYQDEDIFVRASRIPRSGSGNFSINEDWLQQSRMLYKNSSGYALSKVFQFRPKPGIRDSIEISGLSLELLEIDMGQLATGEDGFFPLAHFPNLLDSLYPKNSIQLQIVERRIIRAQTDAVLKWGSGILLLGWAMLIAAACQSGEYHASQVQSLQQWENAVHQWSQKNEHWKQNCSELHHKAGKFLTVGLIGESVPENIVIKRIHIEERKANKDMQITLEGQVPGKSSSMAFNNWLDSLTERGIVREVRNLEFDVTEKGLSFFVLANSGIKEM